MNKSTKRLKILVAVLIVSTGIFIQSLYASKDLKLQTLLKPQKNTEVNQMREGHYSYGERLDFRKLDDKIVPPIAVQVLVAAKSDTNTSISRGGLKLTANNNSAVSARKAALSNNSTSYCRTNYEKDLFCRLVNAEAGGESLEGKLAVATVLINRVKSGIFPNSIEGVVYDKNWGVQFTPILDGRINLPASTESVKAVNKVLDGYRSFDASILYFLNPKTAESKWIIENKVFFKSVGGHDFYH